MTLEEERRLFYVAVTRARHEVTLITSGSRFGDIAPSATFLRQLVPSIVKVAPALVSPAQQRGGAEIAVLEREFVAGSVVQHSIFGRGTVMDRAGSILLISFEDGVMRKLELMNCLKKYLLEIEA